MSTGILKVPFAGSMSGDDLIQVNQGSPPITRMAKFRMFKASSLPVQFTDQSVPAPTSWAWNFGDGGTSTAQNPLHTYTAAGTFAVSLVTVLGTTTATATGPVIVTST